MKQVEIIVKALQSYGGKATYTEIYREYENITNSTLTSGQKAGIRKTIEMYSSDSDNYTGKADLFYSVYGKGKGTWGLRK